MKKSEDAAWSILEELSSTNSHWGNDRQIRKAPGMIEVNDVTALKAQIEALTKQVSKMGSSSSQASVACCELCFGPHVSAECEFAIPTSIDQVAFVNYNRNYPNQNPQNNSYQNTYNHPWRQNPLLSWKDTSNTLQPPQPINQRQPPGFQVQQQQPQAYNRQNPGFQNQFINNQAEKKPSLEDMFTKYMGRMDNRMEVQDAALKKLDTKIDQLAQHSQAAIQNLEVQVGQLARGAQARQQGTLPSDTIINPKEQCKAITLRSGKEVELPRGFGGKQGVVVEDEVEEKVDEEERVEEKSEESVEEEVVEKEKQASAQPTSSNDTPQPSQVKAFVPPIPYPQRLKKYKEAQSFAKFLEVFKKLHINIPFAEALAQMPTYVKFLKELLSNKRKLEEFETVALTEECSAILQNKLPPKLKDPGKFTIPCTIGTSNFSRALIDSGASINLMPFSVFEKLGVGEVKPTNVTFQLVDRSIKYPRGVMEDVLVKVENLYFLVDFVILEMEEDVEIPLLLGRPFLKTA